MNEFLVLIIVLTIVVMFFLFYSKSNRSFDNSYFEQVFGHMPLPVFILNDKLELIFCNQSFSEITGLTLANDFKRPHKDFNVMPDLFMLEALVGTDENLLQTEGEIQTTITLKCFDGETRTGVYTRRVITNKKRKQLIGVFTDITVLKDKEEQLESSMREFKKLIDDAPDILIVIDNQMKIIRLNNQAKKISEYEEAEVYKHSIEELIPQASSYISKQRATDSKPSLVDEDFEQPQVLMTKSKQELPIEITLNAINFQSEDVYLLSVRDISARLASEEAIIEARLQASFAQQSQNQFLANMSHEIRTPMNAILGFSNLAKELATDQELAGYLTKVDSSAHELLSTINDILDISKIEDRNLVIKKSEFTIEVDILEPIISKIINNIENKSLEFFCRLASPLPSLLVGDSYRIKQVLDNLIRNAIKFTETGSITLDISISSQADDGLTLLFEVTDTGIGISEHNISKLFNSFEQLDTSSTRKFGGVGLGLSISKQLVELMGGTIGVRSTLGKGSVFWFNIPLKAVNRVGQEKFQLLENQNKTALIIDSSPVHLAITSDYIKSFGVERVISTSNVEEAKKTLMDSEQNLDVILIDCDGSHYNNYELLTLLSLTEHSQSTKVIGMLKHTQAKGMKNTDWQGYVDDIVEKPITRHRLAYACENALTKDFVISESNLSTAHNVYDFSHISVLLVEDNDVNQQLACAVFAKLGVNVSVANNGKEAIDIAMQGEIDFDMIFMDIQMPVIDGIKATKVIRSIDQYKDLPIIALTAHALEGDKEKSLSAGMNDHITKPVHFEEVKNKIVSWLNVAPIDREVIEASSVDIKSDPPEWQALTKIDLLSLDTVNLRLDNDKTLIVKMLRRFLDEQPAHVKALVDSLRKCDESAGLLLHTFKSINNSIGFDKAGQYCAQLETEFKKNGSYSTNIISELEETFLDLIKQLQHIAWAEKINDDSISDEELMTTVEKIILLLQDRDTEAVDELELILHKNSRYNDMIKQCYDFAAIYQFDKALNVIQSIKFESGDDVE